MPEENISKLEAEGENPEESIIEAQKEATLFSWEAEEFKKSEFDPWKIGVLAVIAVILIIYAVFTANYLFALILIMAAIIVQIFTKKEPAQINISITNQGIRVNDNYFSYEEDLRSFWILYNPPEVKTLNLDRKQALLPGLILQVENQNPMKIREELLKFLPEDTEKEESLAEKTARRMGI